ncbi:bifunctional metallophosphatase/5'-nucleotidase [Paenibacillus cremeus]|uniref:Bifunctional metallophosphatase/5'-nucleotidase n=1 Tax=Paenibacillus cremeus TaxID=2163881 RepID=A0A559K5I2_9BACL|nr:bifunctional UDP-sugar hydrolase/5'-nucleotidase [Paenibacillus cremeus]TVY07401.1 bifunctional metallophosphatase/5'-nucleotidase [Paenibacillus cremeus]
MNKTNSIRLRIVHTNDIHSRFEAMPAIASIVDSLRSEAGAERTLTLDIGDHIDRMWPATEGTRGRANIAVMNATGYDAVTIGNNEGLTYSSEVLSELYGRHAEFAVVLDNMREAQSGEVPAWAKPAHIIEKAGVRFGLIGVTARFTDFYRLLGWDIEDPFEAVRLAVEALQPQTDLIIVMSHLGLRNDERLAAEVPGIDLILGGHTHHLLEQPLLIGDTHICAAGKFGQYVGVVDVDWDPQSRLRAGLTARVIPAAEAPQMTAVKQLIERFAGEAAEVLDQEAVRLSDAIAVDWYEESPLGNLLAAGLRRRTGAEIGLVNAGQLLKGLPAGAISAGMLLELCPSPINPCRLKLTGAQLIQALEESLLPEFQEKPIYGFGFRGKVLGSLSVDGMEIEYEPQGEPYHKVRSIRVGAEHLVPEREYTVGMIDMFTFGIGYMSLSQGTKIEYFLPEFLRDVLLRELKSPQAIVESRAKRYTKLL